MSSSPKAAWIPPCAFDELFAWSVVFVATATCAPAALRGDGRREPGGAAPDHEHVDEGVVRHVRESYRNPRIR